ncbi:hypothetical protein ABT052_17835 [Streptomyces sp. NPDC002766]|uniref:hypothetical protein n=1 Tax=Streptomyces sp. NPDC002766 TaxID=3154429 RepID=UPI00332B5DAE
MTPNAETPRAQSGAFQKNLADGEAAATVAQDRAPRVAGRLDTYRSRATKWHRQVRVEQCPRCGHPHLHRAPLPLVTDVLKVAPCGVEYVVILRPEAEAA